MKADEDDFVDPKEFFGEEFLNCVLENDLNPHQTYSVITSLLPSHQVGYSSETSSRPSKTLKTIRRVKRNKNETVCDGESSQLVQKKTVQPSKLGSVELLDGWEDAAATNEDAYLWRLTLVQNMPFSMTVKRKYKAQLQAKYGAVERSTPSTQGKNKIWEQFKETVKDGTSSLVIWRKHIKHIEGYFGTSIASYFRFIRWLLNLNLVMFIGLFVFISLPQILFSYNVFTNQKATQTSCQKEYLNSTFDVGALNLILDFLQGTEWMERTVLFIGHYEDVTLSYSGMKYNIPLAYICVVLALLGFSLFRMLGTVAHDVKEGVIVSEGELQDYCNTVFAGWQFCVTKQSASDLRKEMLTTELMGFLETEKLKKMERERTNKEKVLLYFIRIMVFLFIIVTLTAGCFGIYQASDFSLNKSKITKSNADNKIESFAIQYLPSIIITLMNLVMPILFDVLIVHMKYSPMDEIKIKIGSTVVFRLASVGVLLYSFNSQIEKLDPERCGKSKESEPNSTNIPCWETYVGQQIYKLVLLDFIIVILMIFVFNLLRMLLVKNVKLKIVQWIGENNFDISQHVLELIYSQTLCWLGMFFSPLLPLVCIFKFIIFFYAKRFDLLVNCATSRQPYRVSKSNSFFMIILLVCFGFLVFLPLAYFLSKFPPSMGCSPFKSINDNIWNIIPETVSQWPHELKVVIEILTSTYVAIPLIIIIVTIIFYYYTTAAAYKKMSTVLKEYLVMEGRDKQFLLRRYQEVTTDIRLQRTLPNDAKNKFVRQPSNSNNHEIQGL